MLCLNVFIILNIGKVPYNTDVHINGCILPVVTHTRDLGVIVSSDLSPSVHIIDIVFKAHQRAGLILHTFISRDIHLLMRSFLGNVRPVVEYNSIIWSPSTARINALESAQRRFTKRLPTLKNLSYRERLKCLNIIISLIQLRTSTTPDRFVLVL